MYKQQNIYNNQTKRSKLRQSQMLINKNPNVMANQQIWELSLIEVLRKQLSKHTLAVALSKSRHEVLTPQLAPILQLLISKQGQNWRQVATRLIVNNYSMGFENGVNMDEIFPILINQFHNFKNNPNAQMYRKQIWNKVNRCYEKYWDYGKNQRITASNVLQCYLSAAIFHSDTLMLSEAFDMIAEQPRALIDMLLPISNNNEIQVNTSAREGMQRAWEAHKRAIQLLQGVVRMTQKMQDEAVRHLRVQKYQGQLGANLKPQSVSIFTVVRDSLPTLIALLSTIPTFLHKQTTSNIFSKGMKWSADVMPMLQAQAHEQNKLKDYYINVCKIILYFCDVAAFQQILRSNRKLIQELIGVIGAIDIVRLNQYQNLNEQLMSVSNQISAKIFSNTLSGIFMRTIIQLCNNIGGFFNAYLAMLWDVYNSKLLSSSSVSQFISYLLKLSLLSDPEILRHRLQEIQPLLMATAKQFEESWGGYDGWQKIQILRYFLVFVGTDSDESRAIRFTQSGQELISKCISLCLECLCEGKVLSESDDIQLNPLQMQCYHILLYLPQQPNTFRIIKNSLLQTVLDMFLKLPNNSLVCLQLFNKYITCLPELVERSGQLILRYFYDAFMRESDSNRSSGKKVKGTQKITKIIQSVHTILECNGQQRFEDIQDLVVYPILSKLCEPFNISYEQDLLDLLDVLLVKHHHFTPQVVIILSKLSILYEKNEKKLSIFRNIYKGLVAESIKKQILYEYSDVIVVMLQLFLDYTANSLAIEQFMFYIVQVRQLLFNVQLFLQAFSQRILQDNQLLQSFGINLYKNITNCIIQNSGLQLKIQAQQNQQIHSQKLSIHRQFHQILIQYIMTITHICIAPNANSFNSHQILKSIQLIKQTPVANYVYIETLKMIPILFIDQLIINPDAHEQVLNDIVRYCQGATKMEIQGGMNKNWKTIYNIHHWEHWPSRTKDYIDNVLREMRNRRHIDQVDHAQYINALSKYLR